MSALDTFLSKLEEYRTNNVRALEGKLRFTANEREDLKRLFEQIPSADRVKALLVGREKDLDTSGWGTPAEVALYDFLWRLEEYATNNISALGGKIQFTHNEREDLKTWFVKLAAGDRPVALEAAKQRGLDTSGW
ncbi:MAG: hypothetical protein ACOZQL_31495 [Myxococcota bacterium]